MYCSIPQMQYENENIECGVVERPDLPSNTEFYRHSAKYKKR